ncbi:MAG: hypothetical protein ACP5E2_08120 [Terracidiphilus sp.]
MKKLLCIAGLLVLLLGLPAANAADPSGTWTGAFDFEGTTVPLTFHFAVTNGVLTGDVEGLPTTPAEIHDGKVDGGTVTFWVDTDYEEQTYKLVFKGTVSTAGNQIDFNLGTDDGSWSTELTAAKGAETTPVTVSGTWNGSFDFQGTSIPLTFHLTSSAGVVTGTVEGLPTSPAEIHEGKLDGDTVTFWLNTDYEGQTYKLVYKGKVSAGQIEFSFGTDDGSWETELTATKGA